MVVTTKFLQKPTCNNINKTKQNKNLMLSKSSLITTQKQLTKIFGDSKYDSLATSKNPSPKHRNNKNHESVKITKYKKTCKHENTMP
jgi:hypothetical protein